MISDMKKFPKTGKVFKIPDVNKLGNYLVCVANDKLAGKALAVANLPEVFSPYAKHCYRMINQDNDELLFCYDQNSTFNRNINLGNDPQMEIIDGNINLSTSNGDACMENNQTSNWKLHLKIGCDDSFKKGFMTLVAFWKSGNCTIEAIARSREACYLPQMKSKGHHNVKCIDHQIYDQEIVQKEFIDLAE
ncbi:hypothetical protein TRFO_13742 [Tritrichomonas foetus]|uniref:Uncharacterized protein n=1 Tax=Tritrichomonas foetus TaxID=1144522 RepID=A0A1J4L1X8_9EUKA|nr:hypothetical protein TRFO_13742 [Tritrichomonas foetus]|eukprot:OHT15893.1 hypothetical protein TRFO_13742 [Tritrichomonas foetus]